VQGLIAAAAKNRQGQRDALISDLSAGRRDFIFANSEGATSAAEKSNEKNFTDADGCYKVNDVRASRIQSPFKLSPYQKHWRKEGSPQRLLHSDYVME